MKIINYIFCFVCGLIMVAIVGCDAQEESLDNKLPTVLNLTTDQWKEEIQQRFNTINGNGEGAYCINFISYSKPPFYFIESFHNETRSRLRTLQWLVEIGVLTETINSYTNDDSNLTYIYNVTDEGKKYLKENKARSTSVFCFGKVIVQSVDNITPDVYRKGVLVKFSYNFDNLPPKMQNNLKSSESYFKYDNKDQKIYSSYGIGLIVKDIL